jgi:hypothetical protein
MNNKPLEREPIASPGARKTARGGAAHQEEQTTMSYHSDPNWRTRPAPVIDKNKLQRLRRRARAHGLMLSGERDGYHRAMDAFHLSGQKTAGKSGKQSSVRRRSTPSRQPSTALSRSRKPADGNECNEHRAGVLAANARADFTAAHIVVRSRYERAALGPSGSHAERPVQGSRRQEYWAADAGGPTAQQASKLETRPLLSRSEGGTVARGGGNTCAPLSARLDLKAPAVPRSHTDHTGPFISPASMPMARSLPGAGGSGL